MRPKEMFFGNVEVEGKPVPRFEKVDLKDLEKQAEKSNGQRKIKSLLGQAILRVNEVVPDFEDLDKVLPLLRQAIDELDKSDSGSVKRVEMANKQTIKPKVVPFEIAKLLKEVGYDEKIAEFGLMLVLGQQRVAFVRVENIMSITAVILLTPIPSGRNPILSFLLP